MIEQLTRFVTSERPGSEMHGPAMRETVQLPDVNRVQAFRDLSTYLVQSPGNPHPEMGDGRALAAGARAYAQMCAGCHGEEGAGSDAPLMPAIGGQHYSYLVRQLRDFNSGRLAHTPAITGLSAADQHAIADYISRLPYFGAPTRH